MFNCFIYAVLEQRTPIEGQAPRNNIFKITGIASFETEQVSWKNLSSTAKLIFPKNIKVLDNSKGKVLGQPANEQNKLPIVANFGEQNPIVMRGDRIYVTMGYGYQAQNGTWSIKYQPTSQWVVSKVFNKIPIELELQDNMWFLNQTKCPNTMYPAKYYCMEDILYLLLQQVNSTWGTNLSLADTPSGTYIPGVQTTSQTDIGDFRIENETFGQVLTRLQKDYRMEVYFRGDVLHCALFVYLPHTSPYKVTLNGDTYQYDSKFIFEQNICKGHKLEYTRADDVNILVDAFSIIKTVLSEKTKSGKIKTKKKRLETMVTRINGTPTVLNVNDPKQKEKAGNCEIRNEYFWNTTDIKILNIKAFAILNRLYYEGYRGSFVTFGLPFVQHGDIIYIQSTVLPERDGIYFVKGVSYKFIVDGGMRQEIEVDMRIDGVFNPTDISNGI